MNLDIIISCGVIAVRINGKKGVTSISDLVYIDIEGMRLWKTGYPQIGVDYNGSGTVKIIGVDFV